MVDKINLILTISFVCNAKLFYKTRETPLLPISCCDANL